MRFLLPLLLVSSIASADPAVPITTKNDDAKAAYLKGRDFLEKLRLTDAHDQFAAAVAKDKDFASAYLGLAQTSGTTKEFFESLAKAVATMGKASKGEQLLIKAAEAGAKNDPAKQKAFLVEVAAAFPKDQRVQNQLGQYYFGRLDYPNAIAAYEKAIAIDAKFTQPYNQLGYAYRFSGKFDDAKRTFEKYIELLPNDPNPYDSYGELLMEAGKFEESIKSYEKALVVDKNFTASYIGIGNDQIFLGKPADARATFAKLGAVARNEGEKRQAITWTAMAYAHEAAFDKAVTELEKLTALATAAKDLGNLANDYNLIATMLLEAGKPDEALAKFKLQVETSDKSDVPAEVKAFAKRNFLFDEGWVAVVKNDLPTAKAKLAAYTKAISQQRPFEVRQQHELAGQIALAEKKWKVAIAELAQSNPRDPRIFYLQALAYQGAGDAAKAKELAKKAADFNGLAFNLAFVRTKAKAIK